MNAPRLISRRYQQENFQLYTPKMCPLYLPTIKTFAPSIGETTVWLTDKSVYNFLTRNIPKSDRIRYKSDAMKPHVQEMLDSGIIRALYQGEKVKSWCRVFKVPEDHKKRYRLIIEPRMLNEQLKPRLDEFKLRTTFADLSTTYENTYRILKHSYRLTTSVFTTSSQWMNRYSLTLELQLKMQFT